MEGLGVGPATCIHGFISNILSVIGALSFAACIALRRAFIRFFQGNSGNQTAIHKFITELTSLIPGS
ncbi:MAG TPA: hypothetical protein VIY08_03660 [Candidatus Nitrosocosmicus sp.]